MGALTIIWLARMTGDSVKLLAGVSLMLASFGAVLSTMILMSVDLRKQSEAPAFLCLLCSLIYLAAFVYTAEERVMRPVSALTSAADRTTPPIDRAATAQTYSFGNFLQKYGD
jgi:hypothetical protein